jgi:hypothetical protein
MPDLAKMDRHSAYDNPGFRTQDAAILVDALELVAAHRPNFTLRIGLKKGNNRDCVQQLCCFPGVTERAGYCARGAKTAITATNLVYRISRILLPRKECFMAETVVKLRLNQQQLELMDRTIAQGVAPDRVSLVRLALREYAAARPSNAPTETAR